MGLPDYGSQGWRFVDYIIRKSDTLDFQHACSLLIAHRSLLTARCAQSAREVK